MMKLSMMISADWQRSFQVEFIGAEPYEDDLQLRWRVLDGEYAGTVVAQPCCKLFMQTSQLGCFAAAIKGGAIAPGELFAFDDYVGVKGTLIAEMPRQGGGGAGLVNQFILANRSRQSQSS